MKEELLVYFQKASYNLEEANDMLGLQRLNGALNRAYYAVFVAVQAALFAQGIRTKSHSGAHGKFRELYIKTGLLPVELNDTISMVFELRQAVDYDLVIFAQTEEAAQAVRAAEQFVVAVKDFLLKD